MNLFSLCLLGRKEEEKALADIELDRDIAQTLQQEEEELRLEEDQTKIIGRGFHPQRRNIFSSAIHFLLRSFGKSCQDDPILSISSEKKENAKSLEYIESDRIMAQRLQKEQEESRKKRKEKHARLEKEQEVVAKLLQEEENDIRKEQLSLLEEDRALAQILQQQEDLRKKADSIKEQREMGATTTGKAILIVERILEFMQSRDNDASVKARPWLELETVYKDDMVLMVERMLKTRTKFHEKGYSTIVDMGFHYTSQRNMENIQTNGLLSKKELDSNGVPYELGGRGSTFGNGIYTANNPTNFQQFGDVGLIVARLKGKSVRMARFPTPFDDGDDEKSATTIIGNKLARQGERWPKNDEADEIVLRNSSQIVALVKYNRGFLTSESMMNFILHLQREMQGIFDKHLNT